MTSDFEDIAIKFKAKLQSKKSRIDKLSNALKEI